MHIRWRGLELPSLVTSDPKTLSPTYGKFVAEPFERGFGVTLIQGIEYVCLVAIAFQLFDIVFIF